MILGAPWHRDYDPDIDWKGGGHLRPRVRAYPTSMMERAGDGLRGRGSGSGPSENPLHGPEPKPQQVQEEAAANPVAFGRVDGRKKARKRAKREIAVVSVDEGQKFAIEAWVTSREATTIEEPHREKKGDNSIPEEYRGHPAFEAKHLEGLPEYGPFDHEIKLKEGAQVKFFKV